MQLLTNAFIIFHLFIITAWLFPINSQVLDTLNIFRRYIIFLGLDQDYGMFAPDPRKTNKNIFALVTFQDQSSVIWSYPRMERLDFVEAMFKERYRKFGNDNIVQPRFQMFLPDFARYIARLHICPDNSPQLVSIYLCEKDTPQPGSQIENTPRLTNLFVYKVEPCDLTTNIIK